MNAAPRISTVFLLMAQFNGRVVVPIEDVCREFFSHLTPEKLIRKVGSGDISLPVVRMEGSQKAAKGVHIQDLADYLDARRNEALKECRQLCGRVGA